MSRFSVGADRFDTTLTVQGVAQLENPYNYRDTNDEASWAVEQVRQGNFDDDSVNLDGDIDSSSFESDSQDQSHKEYIFRGYKDINLGRQGTLSCSCMLAYGRLLKPTLDLYPCTPT